MIDSRAYSNVVSVSVCKKLNETWEPCPTQIVQLDKSRVKVVGELNNVVGELNNVLLTLSVDASIHHTIDIVVADIPETYGMWLSRDRSENLKGYFATDWSHLWIPYNGRPNQIKIIREPFMKQTIIDLNDPSEPAFFF